MATFQSSIYPGLTLQDDDGIWAAFAGGRFETDDEAVAERLRALPESEGITETSPDGDPGDQDPPVGGGGEGSGNGPEDVKPPARSASKADWKAYAITQGMGEDEADKATRDELAATYADGGGD
ncbi:hypothetical protein ABZ904_08680 [Streptomyces sp. NPDC046900]|uniref:hypothetical protein n=1 Tax=Streptomyces sp. NPDC046900 TaxID=3155473 RepID=UPI0033D60995